MVNAALEKFVLKLSVPVFLIAFVSVFLFLSHSGPVLFCLPAGYLLGIILFEATAALYGTLGQGRPSRTTIAVLFLIATFAVILGAIWITVHAEMDRFWALFAGLMTVPAVLIIYVLLEALRVIHTDFFT